jgi:membrane protein implicated in regulation of membrane protease activity
MIVIIGFVVLAVAAFAAVSGVAANSGGGHQLSDNFSIAGLHLSALSTGRLFLYGIIVGMIGMVGLNMLLVTLTRRMASRAPRRELRASHRESATLREERGRLSQALDDERSEYLRVAAATSVGQGAPPAAAAPDPAVTPVAAAPEPAPATAASAPVDRQVKVHNMNNGAGG